MSTLQNGDGADAPSRPAPIEFGIFVAPWHDPSGNATLQYQRDLQLIELVEELGFAEVWVGEHMSNGHEIILSPEVFLAAAAQRTSRIRLGTGVSSLPYHHPFTLANRIVLLDHLSRGRAMMGIGPGQLPTDAMMLGIDPSDQRGMMIESAEVLVRLLRGETVTAETSWFKLHEARVQVPPCNPDGIPMAVASVYSPTGSTLAGRLGLGLLSMASSDVRGFDQLDATWTNLERHAAEHGHTPDRRDWRVVGAMHLADTAEQARREARTQIISNIMGLLRLTRSEPEPWMLDPDSALDKWVNEGLGPLGGRATIGTPDDAVAAVRRLIDRTGGFGKFALLIHNAAPWEATKRSLELFAHHVIPELNQLNRQRENAREWFGKHRGFSDKQAKAIGEARQQHGAPTA